MHYKVVGLMGNPDIAEFIKFLREKKQYSARHLSLEAGLSASYVNKVESGALEPSLKAFSSIARVLEMTEAEILLMVKMNGSEK